MDNIISITTNNPLLSGLIVCVITGILSWIWHTYHNYRDSNAIYNFLTRSKADTSHTFRSTEAIASRTNLPQSRVEVLCAKHKKIVRNTKERQSWKLID